MAPDISNHALEREEEEEEEGGSEITTKVWKPYHA